MSNHSKMSRIKIAGALILLGVGLSLLLGLRLSSSGTPSVQTDELPDTDTNAGTNVDAKSPPGADGQEQYSATAPLETTSETEIIESIYTQDLDYIHQAHSVAEEALRHTAPEAILRWEPVYIDPRKIVAGSFTGEDSSADSRIPRETIQISPFQDVSFHVSMRKFEDAGWGAAWVGDIKNGDGGTVTIYFAPDEENRMTILAYIETDRGNINLAPTSSYGHYVAVEMNPTHYQRYD